MKGVKQQEDVVSFIRKGTALQVPNKLLQRAFGPSFSKDAETWFYLFADSKSKTVLLRPVQPETILHSQFTVKGWYSQPNASSMQLQISAVVRALGFVPAQIAGFSCRATAVRGFIHFTLSKVK